MFKKYFLLRENEELLNYFKGIFLDNPYMMRDEQGVIDAVNKIELDIAAPATDMSRQELLNLARQAQQTAKQDYGSQISSARDDFRQSEPLRVEPDVVDLTPDDMEEEDFFDPQKAVDPYDFTDPANRGRYQQWLRQQEYMHQARKEREEQQRREEEERRKVLDMARRQKYTRDTSWPPPSSLVRMQPPFTGTRPATGETWEDMLHRSFPKWDKRKGSARNVSLDAVLKSLSPTEQEDLDLILHSQMTDTANKEDEKRLMNYASMISMETGYNPHDILKALKKDHQERMHGHSETISDLRSILNSDEQDRLDDLLHKSVLGATEEREKKELKSLVSKIANMTGKSERGILTKLKKDHLDDLRNEIGN